MSSQIENTPHEIEQIVRAGIEAINARNFDITSSAWSGYAPDFWIDPSGVSFENATEQQVLPPQAMEKMGLRELLWYQQHLTIANPNYRTNILEVATTEVKGGKAKVMMSAESTGIPEGVVRALVNVFEFERVGGKWLCKSLRTLPGVDVGGGQQPF